MEEGAESTQQPENIRLINAETTAGKTPSNLSPDQVRKLPTKWYANFLRTTETNPPESLFQFADAITDKFETEVEKFDPENIGAALYANAISVQTERALKRMTKTETNSKVQPEVLKKWLGFIDSPNFFVSRSAAANLLALSMLDHRNGENMIGIREEFAQKLVQKISNPQSDNDYLTGVALAHAFNNSYFKEIPKLLTSSITAGTTPDSYRRTVTTFSMFMGLEDIRKTLRENAQSDDIFKAKYQQVEDSLGLIPGKTFEDLRNLYNEINFQEYSPNDQLNDYDEQLMLNIIGDKQKEANTSGAERKVKVLDIGTGPGRHISRLTNDGIDVVGFDFVEKHVQQAREANPNVKVMVADWHNMPYKDGEFDVAYCLGRSSSHNTTVEDFVQFLSESKRVLAPNGRLVLDLPDSESQYYREQIKRIKDISAQLGIPDITPGIIIDSPDGKNYFDRFVPSREQFKAIAKLAGFDAELIEDKQYEAVAGQASNLYWNLTQSQGVLTEDQKFELEQIAYGKEVPEQDDTSKVIEVDFTQKRKAA